MMITLIAVGSTPEEYKKKRWGLSFLINQDLLFDTFCSAELLQQSFTAYNIKPGQLKTIVISHEHWDHIGGLWWLLEKRKGIKVYGCNQFSDEFKNKVNTLGSTFTPIEESTCITENIFTTGQFKSIYKNNPLYELSLIIKQENSLALITGCSHPGILNILGHVKNLFKEDIGLLTGGFHLMDKTDRDRDSVAKALASEYQINRIAPLHCTGKKAVSRIKQLMPNEYRNLSPGDYFEYDPDTGTWELKKYKYQ